VNLGSKSASTHIAAKSANGNPNQTAIEFGAGALVLIALGGSAYALMRRRRDKAAGLYDVYEPETVTESEAAAAPRHDSIAHEEPAMIAPSAFAWGNGEPSREETGSREATADRDDRRPGESWVERAYRGPSPDNPSVSLRTRLKRAAFFDKREREVAAGTAEPVDTDAGLPEAMVEEQERELA
jgi:hypothetical protein